MNGITLVTLLAIGTTALRMPAQNTMDSNLALIQKQIGEGEGEVEQLADADIYEGDREGTYVVDTTPGEEDGSFILKENTDGTSDIINVYKSTNDADGEKYVVDYTYGEDGGAFIINTGNGEYAAVYTGEFEGEYTLDTTPGKEGGALELDTATFNPAVSFLATKLQ